MAKNNRKNNNRREVKANPNKINDEIVANRVKIVGDGEPQEMSLADAKKLADAKDMDLVLMNGNIEPAIVKIMDYSKHLYELNKNKTQNKSLPIKEMRFTPNIADEDVKFKLKHIKGFLDKGHVVKAFVFFRGREIQFKDKGEKLLLQLAVDLQDIATVEKLPILEGRKMMIFLKPKKKNEGGSNKQD